MAVSIEGAAAMYGLELLGYIADWIGLDLRGRSSPRVICIVAFYSIIGLVLLIVGLWYLVRNHDGGSLLSGGICSVLGLAILVRIAVNISKLLGQGKT